MTDNIVTDWKTMIHNDALAAKTYALTADQNAAAENTRQENYVNTLAGLPDSQFAGEGPGAESSFGPNMNGMTTAKEVAEENIPYTVQHCKKSSREAKIAQSSGF